MSVGDYVCACGGGGENMRVEELVHVYVREGERERQNVPV